MSAVELYSPRPMLRAIAEAADLDNSKKSHRRARKKGDSPR